MKTIEVTEEFIIPGTEIILEAGDTFELREGYGIGDEIESAIMGEDNPFRTGMEIGEILVRHYGRATPDTRDVLEGIQEAM